MENYRKFKMNLDIYKNNGWGISRLGFEKLFEILQTIESPKVIEFGSGKSTEFFEDYYNELNSNLTLRSFDDSIEFAYKPSIKSEIEVRLRDLVECFDDDLEEMFTKKQIIKSLFIDKTSSLETRQKNNFYKLKDVDIEGIYDIVLLDGPNGNGRNFAFLYLKNHLEVGSFVFIDDHTHYDFVERFLSIYSAEVYFENVDNSIGDKWTTGGNFIIYKII